MKAELPFSPYGTFLASKNSNRAGHHLGLGKIPCRDVAEYDVLLTVSFFIQQHGFSSVQGFHLVSFNIADCCSFISQFVCLQNLRPLQVCPSSILTMESADSLIKSDDEH